MNVRPSVRLAIASALALAAGHAAALTPAQFVAACQSSPGNTVRLSQSLKLQGDFPGRTFAASSGCTVVLAPDAAFELDTITLQFGGPFVLQGGTKAKLQADKATLRASAIDLQLTGDNGELQVKEAQLWSQSGALNVAFGRFGKLEMVNSGGWTRGGLRSAGPLSIRSGAFFSGTLSNSGIEGGQGIRLAIDGEDSAWKIEKSTLNVSNWTFQDAAGFTVGPMQIIGAGRKAKVEIIDTNLRFASSSITMSLTGAESALLLKNMTSQTGSEAVYLGATGDKGIVLVEGGILYGNPDVTLVSGPNGTTAAFGNPGVLYAQQRVSVSTGAGGSCTVFPASMLTAPQTFACR